MCRNDSLVITGTPSRPAKALVSRPVGRSAGRGMVRDGGGGLVRCIVKSSGRGPGRGGYHPFMLHQVLARMSPQIVDTMTNMVLGGL